MLDEARLIVQAAAGNTAAFRQLYEHHRAHVARLVYRMLCPRSGIEDVIEEVFVQLYESLRHFRSESEFRIWLYRVTVDVVHLSGRAARSGPAFANEPPGDASRPSSDAVWDEEAERDERVRAFERLLSRLAHEERIVFVLHELEEIPPEEIAKIVGAPVLTVRRRLLDAHRELEAMLADELAPGGTQNESVSRARLPERRAPQSETFCTRPIGRAHQSPIKRTRRS
jgi:RNA polymerase sigma-70 factor (ECF subfamily)